MGFLQLLTIATMVLLGSRVLALKCYECQDVFTDDVDTDASCRLLSNGIKPKECPPPSAGNIPVCLKVVGTLAIRANMTTLSLGDVVRECSVVRQSTSTDDCKTGKSGQPLGEFSELEPDGSSLLVDINAYCFCSTDGCNVAGALQPTIWWLAVAFFATFLRGCTIDY